MGKSLFVGNLAYSTSEEALTGHFEAAGFNVVRTKIVLDRDTGRPRGFAFVELDSDDIDPVVDALDGQELDGRQLNIREARERAPRPQPDWGDGGGKPGRDRNRRGGGGGGGGGGRRGGRGGGGGGGGGGRY